ncbi:hypothetical protein FRB95_005246 [Tulasnella sp. JGI-2019a]|nr:hypothetical protein FRB95_005246 [Tulasnella sp. JGI-2019a]
MDILGVALIERQRVAQTRDVPQDFDLQIDIPSLRARLLGGVDLSMIAQQAQPNGFASGNSMAMARPRTKAPVKAKHKSILAFSTATPVQLPDQSDSFAMDVVPSSRRSEWDIRDKGKEDASETTAAKLRTQLELVSRVFGANSSLVVFRDSFKLWMKVLGWRAEADITAAVDMTEDTVAWARGVKDDEDRSDEDEANEHAIVHASRGPSYQRLRSRHALMILPVNSEADVQQQSISRRKQDFLALQLAHNLFVAPQLSAPTASSALSPFPLGVNFSSFQLTTPPIGASPSPHMSSPPSPVPQWGGGPQLITPAHVLTQLAPKPFRSALLAEFKGVMELHSTVSLKAIVDRVDAMFEWAEAGGSSSVGNDEMSGDGGSTSSPSSSAPTRTGSKKSRPPATTQRSRQLSWPAPTLSFFAVASAAFAIGAQSHSVKLTHGFPTDSEIPPPSSLPLNGLSPPISGHHFHSLSRAALIAHKQLDVPPSLDTIVAHILGWIYRLHAFNRRQGDEWGSRTGIDTSICRELGDMIALARIMGLSRCDDVNEQDVDGEGMGVWEREMRRRVWWDLMWWDLYISEAMGQSPFIEEGMHHMTMPADVNDWRFNPTSTEISSSPPIEGGELGQNATHFILKCQIMKLHKELNQIVAQGNLSPDAAEDFDEKITRWRDLELPDLFMIDFRPTLTATIFPASDLIAAQACDIHVMINCLLLKLWLPFLSSSSNSSSAAPRQTAEVCATAAHAIVISAVHCLRLFKSTHPLRFGSYWFTRSMFLAATVLGSVLIETPGVLFAETAKASLNMAIDDVFKDPVVTGLPAPPMSSAADESSEVLWLLDHIRKLSLKLEAREGLAAGSKRKTSHSTPAVDTVKLRGGFQLPYVGGTVQAASTDLEIICAPPGARAKQRQPALVTIRDGGAASMPASSSMVHQRSSSSTIPARSAKSGSASTMKRDSSFGVRDSFGFRQEEPSAGSSGDGVGEGGRTRQKTTDHVIGIGGSYVAPTTDKAYPPPAPSSTANTSRSHTRRPRTGSTGSSHVHGPPSSIGSGRLPVIGVRDRTRTSGSSTSIGNGIRSPTSAGHEKALSSSSRTTGGKVQKRRSLTFQGGTGPPLGPATSYEQQQTATEASHSANIITNFKAPPTQQGAASQSTYPYQPQNLNASSSFNGHQPHPQMDQSGSTQEYPQRSFTVPQQNGGAFTVQNPALLSGHQQASQSQGQLQPSHEFQPILNYQPPVHQPPPSQPQSQPQYSAPLSTSPAVQQDYSMLATMPEEVFSIQTYGDSRSRETSGSSGSRGFSLAVENGPMGYDGASASVSRNYGNVNTNTASYDQYAMSSGTQGMQNTVPTSNGTGYLDSAMDGYGRPMSGLQPQAQQPVQQQYQQQQPQYSQYGVSQMQTQYASNENVVMQTGWDTGGQPNSAGPHPGQQVRTWTDASMVTYPNV